MWSSSKNKEVIRTENLCIYDLNLDHYDDFKNTFNTVETTHWAKVSSRGRGECMIAKFNLFIFDYYIFEYFAHYKDFIPFKDQDFYERKFLFKKDKLNPQVTADFLMLLYDYISPNFADGNYFYDIFNLTNEYNKHSPVRIKVNGKRMKYSTGHSTYKDDRTNKDKIEVSNESTAEEKKEWLDITDGMEIKGDEQTIFIKKIYYKELLYDLFNNLFKMCALAKSLDLKVERNADW